MERIPRQFYTQEFKEEAVHLVISGGLSVAGVGRRLSLSPQTLRNWMSKQRGGKLLHSAGRTMTELEAEVSRLRKELAETRLEKELLKKAMAYLAKESRGGAR